MTDRELYDAIVCGDCRWLVAAIVTGRTTPPDLAGHRSSYTVPRSLPWHPAHELRREHRLRRLVEGWGVRLMRLRDAARTE